LYDGKIAISSIYSVLFADANTELGIGYPEELQSKMNAARSIKVLFAILSQHPTHWNCINIHIVEKISTLDTEAKKLVDYYKSNFFTKKLQDILPKGLKITGDKDFYSTIREKWEKSLDDITVKDIEDHQSEIAEIFGVNKTTVVFKSISKKPVEIDWLIPKVLLHHAYAEYQKNERKLLKYGITSLDFLSISPGITTCVNIACM